MALLKLPVKSPSLKLVLSLLEQDSARTDSEAFTDWLLVHIASENLAHHLANSPEACTVNSLFSVSSKLLVADIKTVCGPAGEHYYTLAKSCEKTGKILRQSGEQIYEEFMQNPKILFSFLLTLHISAQLPLKIYVHTI